MSDSHSSRIKLTFAGDIMCEVEQLQAYTVDGADYDFREVFAGVCKWFADSDWVTANLETPIADERLCYTREQYSFNTPIEFARAVKACGVDLVSTANNHCLDRGVMGLKNTISALDACELAQVGINADAAAPRYLIREIGGIRVAFLAYTYGTNAFANRVYLKNNQSHVVNLLRRQELSGLKSKFLYGERKTFLHRALHKMLRLIFRPRIPPIWECSESGSCQRRQIRRDMRACREEKPDFIVVCMHEGGQYNPQPLPRTKKTASFFVEQGANAVIGNHEHVVHCCDANRLGAGTVKAYALGNFCGTVGVHKAPYDTMSDCSVLLHLYLLKEEGRTQIEKCTFSVLKSISCGGDKVRTVYLFDLIEDCANPGEKECLLQENLRIVNVFTGRNYEKIANAREYDMH